MEETLITNSPPPCPNTVTVRRNPPRRARPTPCSAVPLSLPPPSKSKSKSKTVRSFPIHDILSIQIPDDKPVPPDDEKLKVFLRIRPIVTQQRSKVELKSGGQKNVWPQNPRKKDALKVKERKKSERCLKVNDERSVTVCPPADARRTKSEVYEGFSCVFGEGSTQSEVYERMMYPLVMDFLKGKSGMLAAMGPSGSGKTHTVFGSTRQPGMVALALRQIFSENDISRSKCSRTFHLSMFEIYSERGKGEKIMDLSQEGGDLFMQQSNIKGLKEEVIQDVQQAESLIASGMLKRSTAMTNSNIQSSRSQCIINIRCVLDNLDEDQSYTAVLTIVDLAGAEREKKTGNQGARLLESNFINNTSMVFGLCLRSLLEHQRNPKKPLHKHFQNSMLTKYLRDFLEGKKRMALILTAKPGEEDYQDTSYLLRQASPFMNIKFESIEEQPIGNKRRIQTLPKAEVTKRMKLSSNEVCMDDEVKGDILDQSHKEELISEPDKDVETNGSSFQIPVDNNIKANKKKVTKESITDQAKTARENQILSNFSKALWKVLKEHKNKLEASENEANALRHNLTAEKERVAALESELNFMKASCLCGKSNAQVSSHSIKMECIKKKQIATDPVTASVPLVSDCFNTVNLENQVDAHVSCSNHCEETVDTSVISNINDTSSVEVASALLNVQSFEEHKNEENIVLCEYVVFDKEDLIELGDSEFINNIAESGVDDLHGDKGQMKHEEEEEEEGQIKLEEEELVAQDSSSEVSESECFQKPDLLGDTVTMDHEISPFRVILKDIDLEHFEEQSNEKVDVDYVLSPNVFSDKQEFKETEERVTNGEIRDSGCDNLESTVCDSELHLHGENNSSFVKEDRSEHEEDANAHVSSSHLCESHCDEKQDILDDTGISFVEVISSALEKFEDQSKEILDLSTNAVCDNQEPKEVENTEADGEVTELHLHGENNSSFVKEDQSQHEEDANAHVSSSHFSESQCDEKQDILDDTGIRVVEVISGDLEKFDDQSEILDLSSNAVCDKQKMNEVEKTEAGGEVTVADEVSSSMAEVQQEPKEKEVNAPISSSDLEGSKFVGNTQLIDLAESSDQQLVLHEDVISSQSCNASKLPEVPHVQPSQPLPAVKPKRRLRPASSLIKNITSLEFDDATTMPKQHRHGKRDENEDGRIRTQGNTALLRILLRH